MKRRGGGEGYESKEGFRKRMICEGGLFFFPSEEMLHPSPYKTMECRKRKSALEVKHGFFIRVFRL